MKKHSTLIAFICAFTLHLVLGALLLLGVDFSLPKEKPPAAIINASVIEQKMFDDLAARKEEKQRAEQREKELLRKEQERIQQEKMAQEKAQRIAQEKAAREKAEKLAREKAAREKAQRIAQEKAAREKAEKLAREKAAREKAEKLAREKAAREKAEKLAREEAAREKAEKLAREKAAREKAEKLAREKAAKEKAERIAREKERRRQAELDKLMEAEFAEEFSSAQSAKQLSEIARYKTLIQNKISRNWQIDPDMRGKSCTLAIRLAPDGLVLSVQRSRGDDKLCASAKRAAFKAKTLPIPSDPEIAPQFRDFDITLEPDL